jgi:hypothetical protein
MIATRAFATLILTAFAIPALADAPRTTCM